MMRALVASLVINGLCWVVVFTSDLSMSLGGHHSVCGVVANAGMAHAALFVAFLGSPTTAASSTIFSIGVLARRGRRLADERRHRCPHCGDDLRASPGWRAGRGSFSTLFLDRPITYLMSRRAQDRISR
jgi:hypothetical protein